MLAWTFITPAVLMSFFNSDIARCYEIGNLELRSSILQSLGTMADKNDTPCICIGPCFDNYLLETLATVVAPGNKGRDLMKPKRPPAPVIKTILPVAPAKSYFGLRLRRHRDKSSW